MDDYLTTAEVARHLRLKERAIYELVRQGRIPCSKVTGKLLFPRRLVDAWVLSDLPARAALDTLPVVAGSHDLLLEWALRESTSPLALHAGGSWDGLRRLVEGQARVAAIHLHDGQADDADGAANRRAVASLDGPQDLVLIRWARRRQGLIVARDNPLGIGGIADLSRPGLRIAQRQPDAGSWQLLRLMAARHDVDPGTWRGPGPLRSESELALAVLDGQADVGLGVEAAARRFGLGFVPLHEECVDLAMRRRDYFEPAVQALLRFAREPRFEERARRLGGYEVSEVGEVAYNR